MGMGTFLLLLLLWGRGNERLSLFSIFYFLSFTTGQTKQAAYLQNPQDYVLLLIELPIFHEYSMPVRQEKVFFLRELYFTVAYCIPFRLWIRRYDLMGTEGLERKWKYTFCCCFCCSYCRLFSCCMLLLPLFMLLQQYLNLP